mmetsp:Transcript_15053/g.49085  ORF Transcript_15053/g.49085 Transcript_15053/m.49085 type:complete len:261 (+) Transcript_15053:227-1009(+)
MVARAGRPSWSFWRSWASKHSRFWRPSFRQPRLKEVMFESCLKATSEGFAAGTTVPGAMALRRSQRRTPSRRRRAKARWTSSEGDTAGASRRRTSKIQVRAWRYSCASRAAFSWRFVATSESKFSASAVNVDGVLLNTPAPSVDASLVRLPRGGKGTLVVVGVPPSFFGEGCSPSGVASGLPRGCCSCCCCGGVTRSSTSSSSRGCRCPCPCPCRGGLRGVVVFGLLNAAALDETKGDDFLLSCSSFSFLSCCSFSFSLS